MAVRSVSTTRSMWAFSKVKGGEMAMMSPVTRTSSPASKQRTNTS